MFGERGVKCGWKEFLSDVGESEVNCEDWSQGRRWGKVKWQLGPPVCGSL